MGAMKKSVLAIEQGIDHFHDLGIGVPDHLLAGNMGKGIEARA